jgi:hypothetical protein
MNKSNRFKELGDALKEKETPETAIALPPPRQKKGKRSNPDFEQVGAYIEKKIHMKVKKRLLDDPERDFSDLINDLLTDWLMN